MLQITSNPIKIFKNREKSQQNVSLIPFPCITSPSNQRGRSVSVGVTVVNTTKTAPDLHLPEFRVQWGAIKNDPTPFYLNLVCDQAVSHFSLLTPLHNPSTPPESILFAWTSVMMVTGKWGGPSNNRHVAPTNSFSQLTQSTHIHSIGSFTGDGFIEHQRT